MRRKTLLATGFVGLGLFIFSVVSLMLQLDLPKPTGPFQVGRTARHWVDHMRPEVLTDDLSDFRELPVVIWYPADASADATTPYFPDLDRLSAGLAASGEVDPLEVFGMRFVKTHETPEAPLSKTLANYPVIIFSPGNGTNVEFYASLAGELASYGYIVVGINHPYDIAAVALQNGRVAQFIPGPFEISAHQEWIRERVAVRTVDILFVLAELNAVSVSDDSLLARHFDLVRVGVMGHSLGGINAAEACHASMLFQSCLNLDGLQSGGPFSARETPAQTVTPNQPFMMITKEPKLHPAIIALFDSMLSGSYRVVIRNAAHDSFTDGPVLIPSLLPAPNEADRVLALIRQYMLAFFDQTLKQQSSSLLEQSSENSQVTMEVYPP